MDPGNGAAGVQRWVRTTWYTPDREISRVECLRSWYSTHLFLRRPCSSRPAVLNEPGSTVGDLDGSNSEAVGLKSTGSSAADLILLALWSLVPTVASLFHGGRNKATDTPMES